MLKGRFRVTEWPSDQVTKWPSDWVIWWQEALQTIGRMVYFLNEMTVYNTIDIYWRRILATQVSAAILVFYIHVWSRPHQKQQRHDMGARGKKTLNLDIFVHWAHTVHCACLQVMLSPGLLMLLWLQSNHNHTLLKILKLQDRNLR